MFMCIRNKSSGLFVIIIKKNENNEYSFVNNRKYKEKGSAGWGSNPHLLQSGLAP